MIKIGKSQFKFFNCSRPKQCGRAEEYYGIVYSACTNQIPINKLLPQEPTTSSMIAVSPIHILPSGPHVIPRSIPYPLWYVLSKILYLYDILSCDYLCFPASTLWVLSDWITKGGGGCGGGLEIN